MKKIVVLLSLLGSCALAQTGKMFPPLVGTSLDDKPVSVPAKNGKYSIVAVAYDRDAEDNLKGWLNPIYDKFIKKGDDAGGLDMAEMYDVNFVFIPMIRGMKKVIEEFKSGTDKGYWPYIVDTRYDDISGVQKALGVTDENIPYFYVLDKDGKIIEAQSGKFSAAKMEKLEDALD